MRAGPGKVLGEDILKILYAAEDEKVKVSATGKLAIIAPNGERNSSQVSTGDIYEDYPPY